MRTPAKPSSSSRPPVYKHSSPAQSTTSLSDDDNDDDFNKSAFFPSTEPVAVSPAQWSRLHLPNPSSPTSPQQLQASPAMKLPPEILIHILKHLHSARDLYHSMLVCRAWCECSVELLWHRPNISKLSTLGKMVRVMARDDQTFLYARFIRRLNFLFLGADLTDSLFSRLAQCVRLERLTLINCNVLSDGALARVLPCCPNLVALDLTGVAEASDRAIVALASSTKRLQGINLGGCKKVSDKGILALAANCPLLRRAKFSGVDQITDEAVSALAKSCPLLIELDLNHCKRITDVSVRDLWQFCNNMRELRLSHCSELTDFGFPAPPKPELIATNGPNPPFPSASAYPPDKLHPLVLARPYNHLRMLDLTACSHITDEAVEGIVAVAPKIRNLVLAKCTLLTDRAVEAICGFGKHLHYLHMGHASSITDRSIRTLARSCTRLRYIDLANCTQLTDMSVFELAGLQKLRRVGLVRVNNLTDQAIYSLAERHSTLERIHLSYCDQITVMAIHFLLQKLPKLTHLSLTGVPAFRRSELQQWCRDPPPEFNSSQRAAFCVYSGQGVSDLREYLAELFNTITDEISGQNDTEYDDDAEDGYPQHYPQQMDIVDDDDDDDDDDEYDEEPQTQIDSSTPSRFSASTFTQVPEAVTHNVAPYLSREMLMSRDRVSMPVRRSSVPSVYMHFQPASPVPVLGPPRRARGFGHQPIIEASTSPTPSDGASNRSGGTNHSTGTGFFRNYTVETAQQSRSGVITPDLIYAEIGHGRGTDHPSARWNGDQFVVVAPPNGATYSTIPVNPNAFPTMHAIHDDDLTRVNGYSAVLVDTSNSYQRTPPQSEAASSWTHVQRESTISPSSSSTARDLQDSTTPSVNGDMFVGGRELDARGRSVKRSLRDTINAAEQYASSFLFGRGSSGNANEGGPSSSTNPRNSDFQSGHH